MVARFPSPLARLRADPLARRWAAAAIVAAAVCTALVVLHIVRYPTISPVDEFHHIDYAAQLSEGGIVGRGDRFGMTMMREFSCRRLDATSTRFEVPRCDAPASALRPEKYPESGYNSAYIHPPTYYAVAALGGMAAGWVDGSFVVGARMANLAWLLLFVALLMTAGRWLRLSPAATAAAAVIGVANPGSLHALSTVNPDAAGLACGAMALVGYLGWRRTGSLRWLIPVVLPVIVKSTHGIASVAALGLIAVECWVGDSPGHGAALRERASRLKPFLVGSAALGAAAVSVLVLQRMVVTRPAEVIDQLTRHHVDAFPVDQVVWNIILVPPLAGYLPHALGVTSVHTMVAIATLLVLLGAVFALANRRDPDDQLVRNIGVAAFAASICAGPGLVLLNYSLNEIYVPIPPRYLIALVPWVTLVAASAFDRVASTRRAWSALALASWVVLVVAILQAPTIGVVVPP